MTGEVPVRTSLSQRASSIQRLFRSTVTSSDRSVISQFLHDAEMEIKSSQIEIHRLKSAILSLEHKRDGLKKTAAKYRSLLSPVHRVPPEILRCILGFACQENQLKLPSKVIPVFAISATCGRWRDIALSMPSLWSHIRIDLRDWKKDHHILAYLIQLFLDRSKSSPLTLELHFGLANSAPYKPCLALLIQQSSRWRSLSLWEIDRADLSSDLFRPIRGDLPLLEELDISGTPGHDADQFHCDLFSVCPKLSTLCIQAGIPIAYTCDLPWSQVKTLQLYQALAFDALPVIALCQNIDHLELLSIGNEEDLILPVYQGDPIISAFQKLSITEVMQDKDVSCIFQHLTLRHLTELHICGSSVSGGPSAVWKQWDEAVFMNFLVRSSCSITSLTLVWVPMSDEQLIRLLECMPHLKMLTLEEYPAKLKSENQIITLNLLKSLFVDHEHTDGLFLPRLINLKLLVHADSLDEQALVEAIMSRWNPDTTYASEIGIDCLKTVDIILLENKEDLIDRLTNKLRWMGDAGGRVTIVESMDEEEDQEGGEEENNDSDEYADNA
uniref:Uncharacterized protein n=2 Tax=Moniliophthora roreri TaxID=221103 RepID=A0A0W0F3C0_MONRR